MDFSVIKEKLCMWLEENWDHKFLCWVEDDVMHRIYGDVEQNSCPSPHLDVLAESLVWVPFNPTAENMAGFLLQNICPLLLMGTNVQVIRVTVEETRKCSASVYQLSEL
jgi:6-pyruvoyltetrahydropterin/6-carboxytetrahydropterin synthase